MHRTYYDFFAGGGMAGVGLGPGWTCLFANDVDAAKAAAYRANHHGGAELLVRDVAQVTRDDLPGAPDLAWASFPCQDLSLAGRGLGLEGRRSGLFRPFCALVGAMRSEGRAPKIVALENVVGAITGNGGRDFATLVRSLADLGYRCGAMVVDAIHFLPQSRPRFFLVGLRADLRLPDGVVGEGPSPLWHPRALIEGCTLLSEPAKADWLWWRLPTPPARVRGLSSVIETEPTGVRWHGPQETAALLSMMSPVNLGKVDAARQLGRRVVGAVYRRTRPGEGGARRQRAEVRFDEVAGCLRTPAGGSSRQTILVVEGGSVRSRLLSAREAARLMGLPDDYVLPARYNAAYKLAGDGVAAPVVRHLAGAIFEPILEANRLSLVA